MPNAANITGYQRLAVRLNRFPQGAPPSRQLYEILAILFTEREAQLVSQLPVRVFNARRAARAWKMGMNRTRKTLNRLCRKALLVDIQQNGEVVYCLPPPMAGFFEFSLMRQRSDIDQRTLAALFYRYINLEEDFAKALFGIGETPLGRIFVDESQIPMESSAEVLDHHRVSEVIASADAIGVSQCYCREKMGAVDRGCTSPKEVCMTLNTTADSLIRHGHARAVTTDEALEVIARGKSHNLVQFGENVREGVNFICNCCKCCCEGMLAARRFAMHRPVSTAPFLALFDEGACSGCGLCAEVCPMEAVAVPERRGKQPKRLLTDLCLGCGVCANACPTDAIVMRPRAKRVITPLNTAHRVVLMAIERNKLQHIIFDNQVLFSHRAMATLLSVILQLPAVKRVLAGRQLESRYLETLIQKFNWQPG